MPKTTLKSVQIEQDSTLTCKMNPEKKWECSLQEIGGSERITDLSKVDGKPVFFDAFAIEDAIGVIVHKDDLSPNSSYKEGFHLLQGGSPYFTAKIFAGTCDVQKFTEESPQKRVVNELVCRSVPEYDPLVYAEKGCVIETVTTVNGKRQYIVRIGDQFVSSPTTILRRNKEFAGIIESKAKAQQVLESHCK